jgi:hypothetical protein
MIYFDIKDYVKVYKDVFDASFCQQTIAALNDCGWNKHQFHSDETKETISYPTDFFVSFDNFKERKHIQDTLWNVLDRYIRQDIQNPTYTSWCGYTSPRFNRYGTGTEMREHCDHIQTVFDGARRGIPVLSILGALNDDYEGGEFVMWGTHKFELPAGSVMVFPSNFMYPHKVNMVTSGTRYTYVSWVW